MKPKLFFAFFALLCTVMSHGADAVRCDLSTNTCSSVDPDAAGDPIAAPAARQHLVLWDTTHGSYNMYNPLVGYTTLIAMLTDSGYTVQAFGGGVHTIDLHAYDIIVIGLGSAWYSIYTQEEVDSIVSFFNDGNQRVVLTGDINFCDNVYGVNADNWIFADNIFDWLATSGGLFVMGDNSGCPNMCINPVLNAFHMSAGLNTITPSDLYFSNFAAHPIFNNVSQVYYIAGGMISANTPAAAVAWTSNNEPVVAALDLTMAVESAEGPALQAAAVMPNPFTGRARVTGRTANEIKIFDVSGKLVEKTRSCSIGDRLKPGVYFVEIDGGRLNKIIKIK